MSLVKCIVIDDEFLARKLLEDYINKIPELTLKKSFHNAIDALGYVQSNDVDLIFCDVEMPDLSGIDFIKSMNKQPAVILTTAYDDFALQGYELNVEEYLLKPFSLARFVKAVNKVTETIRLKKLDERLSSQPELTTKPEPDKKNSGFLFVKDNRTQYKVFYDDILFVEGALEYVHFRTCNRNHMSLYSLKELERILPEEDFIRVHKSYIVSLKRVQEVSNNYIVLQEQKIPIGKTYKTEFHKRFKNLEKDI